MNKKDTVLKFFEKKDPRIFSILKSTDLDAWFDEFKDYKSKNNFLSLCRIIIGQQLSTKVADIIYQKFLGFFADKNMNPKLILSTSDDALREVGLSFSKIRYIKDLANKAKEMDLDNLHKFSNEDIYDKLLPVKGIGPWTVEMFLIFSLKREDVFSFGDLGLKKGLEKIYGLKNPSQKQLETLTEKWVPYRSYACIALWNSLNNK